MRRESLSAAVVAILLAACATQPEKIQTASVSTVQYDGYNCSQIAMELDRVNAQANELHQSLKKKADNDEAQMAVGMILFWPTLFFLEGGDGPEATEYSKLKGERAALEKVAVRKQCGLQTATQSPGTPASGGEPAQGDAANSSKPSATPSTQIQTSTDAKQSGKFWLNASQFGRSNECNPTVPPKMIAQSDGAEIYQLTCAEKSAPLLLKCSADDCGRI